MEEKQATFHKIMEEWEALFAFGGSTPGAEDVRAGQALYNAARMHDEETGAALRESGYDPFYDDTKIPSAISWLAERYFG